MQSLATLSINSSSHCITFLTLRTTFDNLRCPSFDALMHRLVAHLHFLAGILCAYALCRQALGIVVVVVAPCVLLLHLRIQLSGWGSMDWVGGPGAGVHGDARGIDTISTIAGAEVSGLWNQPRLCRPSVAPSSSSSSVRSLSELPVPEARAESSDLKRNISGHYAT
jgi:hypothetical protein